MALSLAWFDGGLDLPLMLPKHVEERLLALMAGASASPPTIDREALSAQLSDVIAALLERGVVPPSEKQIAFAVAIAQSLGLELPAQALQDRAVMHTFLAMHADDFKSRRKGVVLNFSASVHDKYR